MACIAKALKTLSGLDVIVCYVPECQILNCNQRPKKKNEIKTTNANFCSYKIKIGRKRMI